jgi:predicted ATPase with chaperone activity
MGSSEIHLDEEAKKTWEAFTSRVRDEASIDSFCEFLTRRYREHILKIALVWAALERSETIRLSHMEAAVAFGDFLFASVVHIFSLSSTLADE